MRIYKIICGCVCALFLSLSLHAEEFTVNADHAEYNGKMITLSGNASVDHDLGRLSADSIVLELAKEKGKTAFSQSKKR